MFYWLTSNIWTMAQQFIVIRNMPTPGSEAALAREVRMARRNQRKGISITEIDSVGDPVTDVKKAQTQRQQPVNKNRAKKQGGNKK
jgi:YidC/Oxa1 family membrane protein insertase